MSEQLENSQNIDIYSETFQNALLMEKKKQAIG